jgi:hypothetical protein
MNCPIRNRCPDEDTDKCISCKDTKLKLAKVGIREAIEYFKDENNTYEHMMGDKAKICIEYRVNQLAIEALEEKLKYDIFVQNFIGQGNYIHLHGSRIK